MHGIDTSYVVAGALAVILIAFTALALGHTATHPLTGQDATDDDETGSEPMVIEDTIITVYAPGHLPALGYVRVPSQQHRMRLDCSDCEAAHE